MFGKSVFMPETITLCRDVIQINRKGRLNLSESVSRRYPDMDDYHNIEVYDHFFNTYLNSLKNMIVEEFPNFTSNDINELINEIQLMMQNTSDNKQDKLSLYAVMMKHPIIKYLWQRTPMIVKQPIRVITGYDDSQLYIEDIPYNLLLIERIINKTQFFYKNDQSISAIWF